MINPDKQSTLENTSTLPGTTNYKLMDSSKNTNHSLLGNTVKEAIQKYIELNPDLRKINTSELSKVVGVTRQRVSQILDELGEILDFGWKHKKNMASSISNPIIDEIYDEALKSCQMLADNIKYRNKLIIL